MPWPTRNVVRRSRVWELASTERQVDASVSIITLSFNFRLTETFQRSLSRIMCCRSFSLRCCFLLSLLCLLLHCVGGLSHSSHFPRIGDRQRNVYYSSLQKFHHRGLDIRKSAENIQAYKTKKKSTSASSCSESCQRKTQLQTYKVFIILYKFYKSDDDDDDDDDDNSGSSDNSSAGGSSNGFNFNPKDIFSGIFMYFLNNSPESVIAVRLSLTGIHWSVYESVPLTKSCAVYESNFTEVDGWFTN